jgi:hypothetical protein
MKIEQIDLLLRLLIAHFLADFVFQTDKIVDKKKDGLNSKHFYIHIAIVGILTYLFIADWTNWWAPIIIMVLHTITDLFKSKIRYDNIWTFLCDQLLHILVIVLLWIALTNNSVCCLWNKIIDITISNKILIIIIGYLLITIPTSILIGYLTGKWQQEIGTENEDSLSKAGKWIGILERILILTFILIKQWYAIGFLIAAKSVFRFGDLKKGKERKKTEYILIGTLLSFTFAIIFGILIFLLTTI